MALGQYQIDHRAIQLQTSSETCWLTMVVSIQRRGGRASAAEVHPWYPLHLASQQTKRLVETNLRWSFSGMLRGLNQTPFQNLSQQGQRPETKRRPLALCVSWPHLVAVSSSSTYTFAVPGQWELFVYSCAWCRFQMTHSKLLLCKRIAQFSRKGLGFGKTSPKHFSERPTELLGQRTAVNEAWRKRDCYTWLAMALGCDSLL